MKLSYFLPWRQQANPQALTIDTSQKYEDFSSISFQASLGPAPEHIIRHLRHQLGHGPLCANPKALTPQKEAVARELLEFLERQGGKIFYTLSGSESVETALKMCRQIRGVAAVLAKRASYHGATLGAVGVSGDWRHDINLTPEGWVVRAPEDGEELGALIERRGASSFAALIFEPITGSNGVYRPTDSWIEALKRAQGLGLPIIVDEVLTGIYRTGPKFAFMHFDGFGPDMICLGKNLTGGLFPMGALWVADHLGAYFDHNPLGSGLTNYGHPLGLAAIAGALEEFRAPSLRPKLKALEEALGEGLRKFPPLAQFRQEGLLAALDFPPSVHLPTLWEACLKEGAHVFVTQKHLILAPPYTMDPRDLSLGLEKIRRQAQGLA